MNQGKGLVTAKSTDGKHRLLLTSWEVLLERLAQRTEKDGDRQARFQVAELRGLACDAIKDEDPVGPYANLKQLIADAVTQLERNRVGPIPTGWLSGRIRRCSLRKVFSFSGRSELAFALTTRP